MEKRKRTLGDYMSISFAYSNIFFVLFIFWRNGVCTVLEIWEKYDLFLGSNYFFKVIVN